MILVTTSVDISHLEIVCVQSSKGSKNMMNITLVGSTSDYFQNANNFSKYP